MSILQNNNLKVTLNCPSYKILNNLKVTLNCPSYKILNNLKVTLNCPSYKILNNLKVTLNCPSYKILNNLKVTLNTLNTLYKYALGVNSPPWIYCKPLSSAFFDLVTSLLSPTCLSLLPLIFSMSPF